MDFLKKASADKPVMSSSLRRARDADDDLCGAADGPERHASVRADVEPVANADGGVHLLDADGELARVLDQVEGREGDDLGERRLAHVDVDADAVSALAVGRLAHHPARVLDGVERERLRPRAVLHAQARLALAQEALGRVREHDGNRLKVHGVVHQVLGVLQGREWRAGAQIRDT